MNQLRQTLTADVFSKPLSHLVLLTGLFSAIYCGTTGDLTAAAIGAATGLTGLLSALVGERLA